MNPAHWPAGVLAGRYTFMTREAPGGQELLVADGEEVVYGVYKGSRRQLPHLPPDVPDAGIKVCLMSHRAAALVLTWGTSRPRQSLPRLVSVTYDVHDHRLRTRVGRLRVGGGVVSPKRTQLFDAAGRRIATMVERRETALMRWLRAGPVRYEFEHDGRVIGRISRRPAAPGTYDVDVAEAVAEIDPRLLLACAVERLDGLSDF
ncbi:hypothetical protein EV385_3261 [Krasilnikovia cinnamomea]|uniref:Uncharacterized protein n=1 Tax=Krasilnikovia cinnamomea TaxID=349313 RepID=A0A4Q7ZM13_9ACTN|nr:hypothetical protein [Krasilnikovia cinnamomea]RZU51433.1 hypothetical protein EV385_3261 [Krasilnikovia cinnamomea]